MDAFDASYSVLGERIYTDDRSWFQRLFRAETSAAGNPLLDSNQQRRAEWTHLSINPEQPQEEQYWTEVIPESKHVLRGASMVGDRLVLSYLEDAHLP